MSNKFYAAFLVAALGLVGGLMVHDTKSGHAADLNIPNRYQIVVISSGGGAATYPFYGSWGQCQTAAEHWDYYHLNAGARCVALDGSQF